MSKQFWKWLIPLIPIQIALQWVIMLLIIPIFVICKFFSKRYEKSKKWNQVLSATKTIDGLNLEPMEPEELVNIGQMMWDHQRVKMVHNFYYNSVWVQPLKYPDYHPKDGHSIDHTCYLSSLAASAGVLFSDLGIDRRRLVSGLGKFILSDKKTMVRNGLTPELFGFGNNFSQDMLAAWLIGLMTSNSIGTSRRIRGRFLSFVNEYIKNGYCVKEHDNEELAPRCRHTPGINWNKWSKEPNKKYLQWHFNTGVSAITALATLACAYKVSNNKKYLLHYWFLKYVCGYGLWKYFPHSYLWKEAAPFKWMQFDTSSAPEGGLAIRGSYFNEIVALHASIAHWMAFPKKKNVTWVKKLRELSAGHYVTGLHDSALYMMDEKYELSDNVKKQLTGLSTSDDAPEYFWIDGPFFGTMMNKDWTENSESINGNVAFMFAASMLKAGLNDRLSD
jgi:hypothetical protein